MTERNVGRPWSAHEDRLLTDAVSLYGPNDNWKTIALSVPGRTNKACRKRWLHSLSPSIKKTAWTSEEDRRLLGLYATLGPKWSVIARQIPGRTDDACSKRYREALDPSLKKDEWTLQEDEKLMEVFGRLGGKWGQVGQELRRSGLGCRNRWRMLERRRAAALAKAISTGAPSATNPGLVESPTGLEQSQITSWGTSFVVEQAPGWPAGLLHGNQNVILSGQSTIPPSSHDFSTAGAQACSPVPHDVSLDTNQAFPPFQYTSSSLSSALSDSQTSLPSPSTNLEMSPDPANAIGHCVQPRAPHNIRTELPISEHDVTDAYIHQANRQPVPAPVISRDNSSNSTPADTSPYYRNTEDTFDGGDNSDVAIPLGYSARDGRDGPQSPASTPISITAPISSPHNTSLPINHPNIGQLPSTSPVASPSSTPQLRRRISVSSKKSQQQGSLRLSSNLQVTSDPLVLPYTCGYERCRVSPNSVSRFITSKELSDHCKTEHVDRSAADRPYRCGLDGCGKSWKSVNGLQYHLQISQAHFQHAISSTLNRNSLEAATPSSAPVDEGQRNPKKIYCCSHPQCSKVYRQLSGLRYHLLHGHPKDMPAQLHVVPPTLARRMAEKFRAKGLQTEGS